MKKLLVAFIIIAAVAGVAATAPQDPPEPAPSPSEIQKMWEASGHSKALGHIINNPKAAADCYACHSAEGFAAKLREKKVDLADKTTFTTVTCLACHDFVNGKYPFKLVQDPEELCNSCHSQQAVLKGKGAVGLAEVRSFHSAVPCVSCHMTERNHLMKVIRPDSPDLSETRIDTCTKCHLDNNRKARAAQIQQWQASYKEHMDLLQPELLAIAEALKANADALSPEMKKKYSDARNNISILVRDRSRGVHNIDYTAEIFDTASKDLRAVKAALK